jgi:tungstate transport system permease protein
MDLIQEGFRDAFQLLVHCDTSVLDAAQRSVLISLLAVGLAAVVGLPIATLLAGRSFPGRSLGVLAFRAGMAFPTVFIGIVCYALFSRRGPLGPFEILYTPWAIVCGEFLLALPLIVSISHGALNSLDPRVHETAWTLGAGLLRRWHTYLSEARVGVMLALLTAFARCVTELGIAMMVGGNIKDRTRTLATATALETGKGEFGRGLAMSLILLAIAVGITAIIVYLSRERRVAHD